MEERHTRLQREREGVEAGYGDVSSPMGPNYFDAKAEKIFRECADSGEPIIIFRAKDVLSLMVIAHYQELLEMYIPENREFHARVAMKAQEVREWMALNPNKVHLPD
jgi:hypothetical protein